MGKLPLKQCPKCRTDIFLFIFCPYFGFFFLWPFWKTRLGLFQNEFAMEESLERGERDTSLPLWDRLQLEQCFECRTDISTIYCLFLFLFYMWPVRRSGLATLKMIQKPIRRCNIRFRKPWWIIGAGLRGSLSGVRFFPDFL